MPLAQVGAAEGPDWIQTTGPENQDNGSSSRQPHVSLTKVSFEVAKIPGADKSIELKAVTGGCVDYSQLPAKFASESCHTV